jgi:hypothetical protein
MEEILEPEKLGINKFTLVQNACVEYLNYVIVHDGGRKAGKIFFLNDKL